MTLDFKSINTEVGFFDEFERPSKEQWKEAAVAALKGIPFDKVMYTETYEGIQIDPIYIAEDVENLPHLNAFPGFQSFARGTKAEGFIGKPWLIAQELKEAKPEEFNQEVKFDLDKGQTAITVVLDQPSLTGCDPAEANAEDVGANGLSLATLADMQTVFDGIDLEQVPILCHCGATALPFIALFAATAELAGKNLANIKGVLGSDPLAEMARHGQLTVSLSSAYDHMAELLKWSVEKAPQLDCIFIQGHPYHDAGAASTEEVGIALATATEYVREMLARGFNIDQVAPHICFGFSIGSNFFMEIAKFRAARILWCQIVESFGGSADSAKMKIHARTSAFNKTVFDAHVNMLRVTSEGFSAAVGGVDSMHISPFDEPIRTPDRFSRRIARNVQIMLQEEARFTMPIDMGGGSYYIEKLTDDFARAAWGVFQQIEAEGGADKALKDGFIQTLISSTCSKRNKKIETRQHEILGTNMYANLSEKKIEPHHIDRNELKKERCEAVALFKRDKNCAGSIAALNGATNRLVDLAIAAVKEGASMGELKATFPEYEEVSGMTPLAICRAADAFEKIRQRADHYKAETGSSLKIFLANMGPIPQHKPRADFTKGFFEVGGFDLLGNDGFETSEEAAEAALASGASIVVVCSSDPTYPDYIPSLVPQIKQNNPEATVIVAGRQKPEVEAVFREAGVDDFIHVKANCYALNQQLQETYMGAKS